jgi:hypothetical protein
MVAHVEQDRVHLLLGEAPDHVGLGLLEHQRARHGGERPAPLRVGSLREVVHEKPELGVAAGLVDEAVE